MLRSTDFQVTITSSRLCSGFLKLECRECAGQPVSEICSSSLIKGPQAIFKNQKPGNSRADSRLDEFSFYITEPEETKLAEVNKPGFVFSAECTIGKVWGLTALKHYGNKVLCHKGTKV